jgi:hypothetical protein
VIKVLKATKSTDEQNFYEDIDYTIGDKTYSLKTQNTALRTGNIAFELTSEQGNGVVHKSWYYNGRAEYYHFLIGSELYEASTSDIKDYVFMRGFDCEKSLGFSARQSQLAIGHNHVNSVCGLINATKLMKEGILVKIAVIH